MFQKSRPSQPAQKSTSRAVDAVRHVGPTLEAEGRFIPTGELPENQIANASGTGAVNVRDAARDEYDREADAMAPNVCARACPATKALIRTPTWSENPHAPLAASCGAKQLQRSRAQLAAQGFQRAHHLSRPLLYLFFAQRAFV